MVASELGAARLSLMEVSVRIKIDAFAATEPMGHYLDARPPRTDIRCNEKLRQLNLRIRMVLRRLSMLVQLLRTLDACS